MKKVEQACCAVLAVALAACSDDLGTAEPRQADSGTLAEASFPDATFTADGQSDVDALPVDGGTEAAVDHSELLPPGVTPPVLWFWRGIQQDNLDWYVDETGRSCAYGDTTMWFQSPGNGVEGCKGAPACDPDHFGTPEAPCTGVDCSWRNWDDPRGPEFRVTGATADVEIHNMNASGSQGPVPDFGFGVVLCAVPGTVAVIDTCPRADVYSCVEDRYPQFVDDCTTVLLQVSPPPQQYLPSQAGCYSTKADVTITF